MFGRKVNLYFALLTVFIGYQLRAQPKPLVQVEGTQDRWITFADNSRLLHGLEVSYLLREELYLSGKYIILAPDKMEFSSLGLQSTSADRFTTSVHPDILSLLRERLPNMNWTHLKGLRQFQSLKSLGSEQELMMSMDGQEPTQIPLGDPHIIIRPRIETLLYASGEKSNRIVYGFSTERLNPYNAGMPGQKDNEFTSSEYSHPDTKTGKQCESLDFFDGQLAQAKKGIGQANFGADADEGIQLFLFGYGFGFKKKSFEVKSEIVFDVTLPSLGTKKEFRYSLKGGGRDIAVGAAYGGISFGVEVGKRKTLRKALQNLIKAIVSNFGKDIPPTIWSTDIVDQVDGRWLIPSGSKDGLTEGLTLVSALGSAYNVVETLPHHSFVEPDASNAFQPFVGEVLALPGTEFGNSGQALSQRSMTLESGIMLDPPVAVEATEPNLELQRKNHNLGYLNLSQVVEPEELASEVNKCFENLSSWKKFLMGLAWLYGYIRFHTVFDQPFGKEVASTNNKIAILGSGIDPKDERLAGSIDSSGFDYISWDSRPSDDLGMGTAAALFLRERVKDLPRLVPLKVLSPFGHTHSSAIYEALHFAASRDDIKVVAIPFMPSKPSEALKDGILKLIENKKLVVVPKGLGISGAVEAPAGTEFTPKGLSGKKLRLSPEGTGVMGKLAEILNSKK